MLESTVLLVLHLLVAHDQPYNERSLAYVPCTSPLEVTR